MKEEIENIEHIVVYWKESSDQNYFTMQNLLKSKDYSWALFLGHLVIEKLLKAHYVRLHKKHVFFTHDLLRLSKECGFFISDEYKEWLDEITSFNLNTRYDNYKNDFYKLCSESFTDIWIKRIQILREWLIRTL